MFFDILHCLANGLGGVYTTPALGYLGASLGTPGGLANHLNLETTHAAGRLIEGVTARAGR
jgi:hypothetical protein